MFPMSCPVSFEKGNSGTYIHCLNLHMKNGGTAVYPKKLTSNFNPFYATVL